MLTIHTKHPGYSPKQGQLTAHMKFTFSWGRQIKTK